MRSSSKRPKEQRKTRKQSLASRKCVSDAVRSAFGPVELLENRLLLAGWAAVGTSGTAPVNGAAMMLLSDGTVLVNPVQAVAGVTSNQPTANWFRLTPNGNDYANGNWSTTGSMSESRLFFTTAMLPDGRVFAIGGEYPKFSNTAEVFNPTTNAWSLVDAIPTPPTNVNGAFVNGAVTAASNTTPITITYSVAGGSGTLSNGSQVTIQNVNGNLAANGTFTISNVTPTTFTLNGSVGSFNFLPSPNATWNLVTPQFGDDPVMLLSNGQVLAGYYSSPATYRFNPAAAAGSQWVATAGTKLHNDQSDEESWVKLPDNSVLSYDVYGSQGGTFQAQRYIPSTDTWVDASSLNPANPPSVLSDPAPAPTPANPTTFPLEGSELGPGLLLPDKRVIFFGANGNTAYYNTLTNQWSAGPQEPKKSLTITPNATSTNYSVSTGSATDVSTFLVGTDDPAAVLPNGHVLVALSPLGPLKPGGGYSFPNATYIYDFDPLAPAASAWTEVTPSGLSNVNAFMLNMVMLPTGQVLLANELGGFKIYTPDGQPNDAWRPMITGIGANGDGTFTLTGTQLNGISEGATYGDDQTQSSNYPILELRDINNNVSYARTYNWSNKGGVASGPTPETVQFTLPPGKTLADYAAFTVVAAGIRSAPAVNGIGPTQTVPEYTNSGHAPAVGWVNGQAYVSWRGRNNHLLNVMRLNADGTAVEPHYVSGATVAGSPALATIGNQMYVAWTGDDEHLYVSTVSINGNSIFVPPPKKLNATSNESPALASFNGKLYIAWTGQGGELLNIMRLNDDLSDGTQYVSGATVAGSPALASAYGRLWVAFTGNTASLYASAVDIDGAGNISVPPLSALPETSDASPGLTSSNGKLYIAWQGQGAGHPNLMELRPDGSAVEPHIVKENDFVAGGLGIGSNNGGIGILAWTSTDSDGTISLSFVGNLPPAFGATVQGGVLVVNGGNVADTITIGKNGSGDFQVTLNGTTTTYKPSEISSVVVYTSPLTNTVNVQSTISGLPVAINTGPGVNTINVATTSHNLVDIAGPLNIYGAIEGTTKVILDDSADGAAQTYTLTSSSFLDNGTTISFANLQGITIKGGGGGNIYNVTGATAGNPVTIDIGSATATINLTSNGSAATSILAPVSITGSTGTTRLNVDDQLDPANSGAANISTLAAAGTIAGVIPGTVTYDAGAHVTAVNLLTSHGGNNSVNLLATSVPISINVSRASNALKANFVSVGNAGSLLSIGATVSLGDPGNLDTIFIDASKDPTVPFTLEQFTPAGDTPFARLLSLSPGAITFRLSNTTQMRLQTKVDAIAALVLADQTGPNTKAMSIKPQPNVTVRNMSLPAGLSAAGLSGLHLTGNTIGTTTLTDDTGSVLDANTMGDVTLSHSTNPSLTGNTMQSLTLTGATVAPVVTNNSIVGALTINGAGASNVTITGNRMGNMQLLVASDGVIENNDIGWKPPQGSAVPKGKAQAAPLPGVGLNLMAAFNGPIDHNDIHDSTVGVNYAVPEQFISNRIFANGTGLIMPINDTTGGLGYFPGSGPNDIFNNTIGVNDTGRMQRQHIYNNGTGVFGSGLLGTDSFDTTNLIESNQIGADFNGTIQFTRFVGNAVGIAAWDRQIILHNLIYRGTVAGIQTRGADDVRIVYNTFYNLAGTGVLVDGGSTRTELYNNILRADGGYDLTVAGDSQSGFFSDYNILYSTGAGRVAQWNGHVYADILDYQRDLNKFDLHSIGTSPAGTWAAPQFVNLAGDDYRLQALVNGQRSSSPGIDSGAAFLDVPALPGFQNLLANPSFETGTTGWAVNVLGGTQNTNPFVFSGTNYFAPGASAAGFAEQTVDLLAAGYTAGNLDGHTLAALFGGRLRSAAESPVDEGRLVVTFLDGGGNAIGSPVILPSSDTTDRWELAGSRTLLPMGTRAIRYRFEATRHSGAANDAYLDGAFLALEPTTTAPDQGAYGATVAGDLTQTSAHIQLLAPVLYADWTLSDPHLIQWQTLGNSTGSPVKITLYQDGPGGPQLIKTISASTPDTGSFSWIPESFGLTAGMTGLRIQVALVNDASVSDLSSEGFSIPVLGHTFYVNDGSTTGDEYTTAVGSNRNTGRSPDSPKPSILSILRDYSLGALDTIYVDSGVYDHSLYGGSIVLSGDPNIGAGQGLTITGPVGNGHVAQINVPAGVIAFDLNAANLVTLQHLKIVGGTQGILLHNTSTLFTGSYLTISGASAEGVRIEANSTGAKLSHLSVSGSGREGVLALGAVDSITDSGSYNNALAGINLQSSGPVTLAGNDVYGNHDGIIISTFGAQATVGNTNLQLLRGNKVHQNADGGIVASGNVLIAGNSVYGNTVGISHSGTGSVVSNVVFNNYDGIRGGAASNNRVYHNSNAGITMYNGSGPDIGNVIYSNGYGIVVSFAVNAASADGPVLTNNLIYANTLGGIQLTGGRNARISNNTVYQPTGDALRIDPYNGNTDERVWNNILAVGSGYALDINLASQPSVTIDYNDLFIFGQGKVGFWSGVGRSTLLNWRQASVQDANSISIDPLFVDLDGADNFLGYQALGNDGRDDDFHLSSAAGSSHGGSLAPVLDVVTGLPVVQAGAFVNDATNSPAIDRGDPTSALANEPAPNGAFVNLGAYGNTLQASKSVVPYVTVTIPTGGEIEPIGQTLDIKWRSQDYTGTADIQLWRQGGGASVLVIATGTANDGDYLWTVPAGLTSASDYYIRVVRSGSVSGNSPQFSIAPPSHLYYVNDDVVNPGDITTAPGNDANDGLTPATPKASVAGILNAYDLGAGDIVEVDYGSYVLANNVVISNQDSGVEIQGPGAPSTTAGANYSTAVLADGPSYYYRFGEASGASAADSSGNSHTATYANGVTLGQPGAFANNPNTAASFDGLDDHVALPSGFQTFPNGLSFDVWAYPTASNNYARFFDLGTGAANNIVLSRSGTSGDLEFAIVNGTTLSGTLFATGAIELNKWQYFAVTMSSAGAVTLYKNGVAVASGNVSVPADILRTSNFIGRSNYASDSYFAGKLDEAAFYDKVLTPAQIKSRYLSTVSNAVINRNNVNTGSYAFELQNADNVTIDHLSITGGDSGIVAASGSDSDGLVVANNDIYGNWGYGVFVDVSNDNALITNNLVHENAYQGGFNGGRGISVTADGAVVSSNTVYNNRIDGIDGGFVSSAFPGAAMTISGNNVYGNQFGINIGYGQQAGGVTVSGNTVHDNSNTDIVISSSYKNSVALGNTVYGAPTGISVGGAGEAKNNIVYNHVTGIIASSGFVTGNRVFLNSSLGIYAGSGATATGNRIYSNTGGLQGGNAPNVAQTGPFYYNNLIYANANFGIQIVGGHDAVVQNNTVYQLRGDALEIYNTGYNPGSVNVHVTNNIFAASAGHAMALQSGSLAGYISDYNDIYVSGTAVFGSMDGSDFLSRAAWLAEFGLDAHSISSDPQFVDPDGADNLLGSTPIGLAGTFYNNDSFTGAPVYSRVDPTLNLNWNSSAPAPGVNADNFTARWQGYIYIPQAGSYTLYTAADDGARLYLDGSATPVIDQWNYNGFNDVPYTATFTAGWHAVRIDMHETVGGAGIRFSWSGPGFAKQIVPALALSTSNAFAPASDFGVDDDFHVRSASPTIDRGDPASSFISEPVPNGTRINQGSYGNTIEAANSAAQLVQVLMPAGLERLDPGQSFIINWRSAGLTQNTYLAQIDAGGGAVSDWQADQYQVVVPNRGSISNTIDVTGIASPAPQQVYQSFSYANNGVGNEMSYLIPVSNGQYTLRLHWEEPSTSVAVGQRLFDIKINGTVVQSNYDVRAAAGNIYKAVTASFTFTASANAGLFLELINKTVNPAFLCGLELTAANPAGVPAPTANIDLSNDGGQTWTSIATDQPMDLLGRGSFNWTVPNLPTTNALIRVRANSGAQPVGVSATSFAINGLTHDFYIDPAGDNANSGRSPDAPMASLQAILNAYDFGPGDVIHVAAGTYHLLNSISFTAQDSGVTVRGPLSGAAVFDRGNTGSVVFNFIDGDDVTLDHLGVTGGNYGIYSNYQTAPADRITLSNLDIYGNSADGISVYSFGSTGWIVTGNKVHDNDQGIEFNYNTDVLISNNQVYNHRVRSISVGTFGGTISGNVVFNNGSGIDVGSRDNSNPAATVYVSGNTAYNNSFGIRIATNCIADSNTVYNNTAYPGWGIDLAGGIARNNVAFGNSYGIAGSGLITNNHVFLNTSAGISSGEGALVTFNYAYNNPIGIETTNGYNASYIRNNIVYGNSTVGILLHYGNGSDITSNTVYQPAGDGVRVDGGAYNFSFKNNIVQVNSGIGMILAAGSDNGLSSDYNDFYITGAGRMGKFDTHEFPALADWFLEYGLDAHSISADPMFADPDGADNQLAYSSVGLTASYYNNETFSGTPVLTRQETQINVPSVQSPAPGVNVDHFSVRWQGYIYIPTDGQWTFSGIVDDGQRLYLDNSATPTIDQGTYNGGVEVSGTATLTAGWHAIKYEWVETTGNAYATLRYAGPNTPRQIIPGAAFSLVAAPPVYIADDNFHILSGSPTIDAGDPAALALSEPIPNGWRLNQGYEGNTSSAATSPAQYVQVLGPNGYEKVKAGHSYPITWRSVGVSQNQTVARLNLGGATVSGWSAVPADYQVSAINTGGYPGAMDLSGVINPAPVAVYQSFTYANSGVGNELAYHFNVPDGSYTLRLHFVEDYVGAGQRKFDVKVNGVTVLTDFDIYANAGAYQKAVAAAVNGTATGGSGILLELVNKTTNAALLCGLEIVAVNPAIPANASADIQLSTDNGAHWSTIAANQPLDQSGGGSYLWTPSGTNVTSGNTALIRIVANQGTLPSDVSDHPFLIANSGHHYYVNDGSSTGDSFTTAVGSNYNSGKSPDQPMASVAALMTQYDLDAGDVIHVDNGTYSLFNDIVLKTDDSGVRIEGPVTGKATFTRGGSSANIDFVIANDVDDVTLSRLTLTGAYYGVYLPYTSTSSLVSQRDTLTNLDIFGTYIGVYSTGSTDSLLINGSSIHDNGARGIQLSGATNVSITNNKIFNHGYEGISVDRGRVISGNEAYGNNIGIAATNIAINDNIVHDNVAVGIVAAQGTVATGNITYRQLTGQGMSLNNSTARANVSYANAYGFFISGGFSLLQGNKAYSNSISGITSQSGNNQIWDNLAYANANYGIQLTGAPNNQIASNTVYQPTGDVIRLNNSTGAQIRDNILWVDLGTDINVAADSQSGLSSDFNVLYKGGGAATVGFWNGAAASTLSDWQTASGQDAHSTSLDPLFVDRDGGDNVLGYNTAGAGYNGGADDDFYLQKSSPAIDRGDSWLRPNTDIVGAVRSDEPATTPNPGSNDYFAAAAANAFTATGTAQNFKTSPAGNPPSYVLNLPFSFPFYDSTYTAVRVGVNGLLEFGGNGTIVNDSVNSTAKLPSARAIAVMWDSISTLAAGDDVFVESDTAGALKWTKIRWQGVQTISGAHVNFSVTLFSDGTFRFDYGSGNTGLSPTVGVSYGNGQAWVLAPNDAAATLTSASSIQWTLDHGFTDIGAYEFRGSGFDVTPPAVTGVTPSAGSSGVTTDHLSLTFSEPLNPVDASAGNNYELRGAGDNGIFGDGDDVLYPVSPQYLNGSTQVTLKLSAALPIGLYRLTVLASRVRDLSGNLLDGDNNGSAGGDFTTTFTITRPLAVNTVKAFDYVLVPNRIVLGFNADVGASLASADLVVTGPSGPIPAANFLLSYDPQTFTATWTYIGSADGILPDGNYHAALAADSVTDAGGNALATPVAFDFFVLAGDVNHDRVVDAADRALVTANLNTTDVGPTTGDTNGDHRVDFADLVAVAQHYGQSGKTLAEGDCSGDGSVGFPDLVAVAQHYGKDSRGDLNGDGVINQADLDIVNNNFGHTLPAATSPVAAAEVIVSVSQGVTPPPVASRGSLQFAPSRPAATAPLARAASNANLNRSQTPAAASTANNTPTVANRTAPRTPFSTVPIRAGLETGVRRRRPGLIEVDA